MHEYRLWRDERFKKSTFRSFVNNTLPETNMETQKGPYKDCSSFKKGAIWISMLVWGSVASSLLRFLLLTIMNMGVSGTRGSFTQPHALWVPSCTAVLFLGTSARNPLIAWRHSCIPLKLYSAVVEA